ncbi:hypothetical protein Zm00014a_028500 [Zea mays]|uniref:VQ domain-containing protein n=1 Tax=Zea mays TaxID=4577 RepID=A0A3L6F4E9_MAIZE|nr:hypothetical protein Zm00014a_028500 [Zea mays]
MYSFDLEQDHTGTAAAARTTARTTYQPCARGARSLQLSGAHHYHPGEQALRTAAAVRPRRAKSSSSRKHAPSSSRRSSTTVVATDVSNFRAMVQELTGFFPPPAAVFRPLPRRVHAASPSVAVGQGCGWERRGSHGSSEAANSSTAGGGSSPDEGPAVPPPLVVVAPQPQPLGVFDGLPDLGSPEFGSWGDLSIDY